MAAVAISDYLNDVQTVGCVMIVELRHHAKCHGDQSNRCRDVSILVFSTWWLPPSWIFKILNF